VTIDENGNETFVTSGALERLRKVGIPRIHMFDLFRKIRIIVCYSYSNTSYCIFLFYLWPPILVDPCLGRRNSALFLLHKSFLHIPVPNKNSLSDSASVTHLLFK
jgi:hypothetical protein